ncbi:hypothetical protein DDZ13_11180 [Coraliomargarita sinensis]|uniref:N-sulphoglucosamine sulphohydrolase C-terminal domain-containing protein n=1 Tax=Coraliomargarita sinensis TaxID=2174842 RepID=A0A317ZHT7_9BACT|nr:hypothetical protein [Coraliomargarita sinensis]PXA03538.1 hypothetical protein DDZ13_11180 [Coraliomargarita sinensis]
MGGRSPENYESDGEDRSAVLKGQHVQRSKPIFWYWPNASDGTNWAYAAVRSGPWKLLRDASGDRIELYDVAEDRAERNNLAAENPEKVEALRERLSEWLSELPERPNPDCFSNLRER